MEKYFVPDKRDIRIGYEYEELWETIDEDVNKIERKWVNAIFGRSTDIYEFNRIRQILSGNYDSFISEGRFVRKDVIRVPYLTKEQIEAEGWKVTQQMMYCEHIMSKDKNSLIYNSVNRELRLFKPVKDMGIELDYNKIVFDGYCKCINQFRTIIKLLNII